MYFILVNFVGRYRNESKKKKGQREQGKKKGTKEFRRLKNRKRVTSYDSKLSISPPPSLLRQGFLSLDNDTNLLGPFLTLEYLQFVKEARLRPLPVPIPAGLPTNARPDSSAIKRYGCTHGASNTLCVLFEFLLYCILLRFLAQGCLEALGN